MLESNAPGPRSRTAVTANLFVAVAAVSPSLPPTLSIYLPPGPQIASKIESEIERSRRSSEDRVAPGSSEDRVSSGPSEGRVGAKIETKVEGSFLGSNRRSSRVEDRVEDRVKSHGLGPEIESKIE